MSLISQHWLTTLIILLILVIAIDGLRKMFKNRKDSIKMALRSDSSRDELLDDDQDYGSEFPNGGARKSEQEIDKGRIQEARKRFNFGDDMPTWKSAVKAAQEVKEAVSPQEQPQIRVEPSIGEEPSVLDEGSEEPSANFDQEPSANFDQEPSAPESEEPSAVLGEQPSATNEQPSATNEQPSAMNEQPSEPYEEPLAEDSPIENDIPESLTEETHQESAPEEYLEEKRPTAAELVKPEAPVQVSLDLDEDVPMLMDEVQAEAGIEALDDISPVAKSVKQPPQGATTPQRSANKPRFESRYTDIQASAETPITAARESSKEQSRNEQGNSAAKQVSEVIVINLKARNGALQGADLLDRILENGLRFGGMGFFHRHAEDDGEGEVLFSMANLVKPGTFDLPTFDTFETIGLSFFMTMPVSAETNMEVFELMLITTQNMAESLDAELLDEQRSVLTGQTIEHYRERIRDFTRRQQLGAPE